MVIEVTRTVRASIDQVWAVLADGWSFATWVVGVVGVRDVSVDWPREGAVLHADVGSWPLLLSDETTVLRCTPSTELVLRASAWPLGEATVELLLTPVERYGCTIVLREDATAGPGWLAPYPLRAAILGPRNVESVRRLGNLADRVPQRP